MTKMSQHDRGRRNAGFVVVSTAALLVVLLGFLALAVGVGVLYSARTSSQAIGDAAALAGAFTFITQPNAPQPATAQAFAVAIANEHSIFGIPVSITASDVAVDLANRRVTVDVSTIQPTFFAKVFSVNSAAVATRSVAEAAAAATAGACAKPWFIPNTILATPDPAAGPCAGCDDPSDPTDAVELLVDPAAANAPTAFALSQVGAKFPLKPQRPGTTIAPGSFYAIQFNGTGGDVYRENIESCLPGLVACFSSYSIETGNMVGPTNQGVDGLVGSPGDDIVFYGSGPPYQRWQFQPRDGGLPTDISHQMVIAPIWDTCGFPGFCPAGDFPSGTNVNVQIIGFALMFLRGLENVPGSGQTVMANLLNVIGCDSSGGGSGSGGGAGGGPSGSPVFSLPLRLVHTGS